MIELKTDTSALQSFLDGNSWTELEEALQNARDEAVDGQVDTTTLELKIKIVLGEDDMIVDEPDDEEE